MSNNKKQKREYKTLLLVLANGCPDKASALLKKYSGETAQNPQDLANKLARAYALAPYKLDIEKDFANIHPHRDFILKYTEPKVVVKEVVKEVATEPVVVKLPEPKPEVKSKADGDDNCPSSSNCSGCGGCCNKFSNASGSEILQPIQNNNSVMVLGMVSIVAIFGMVLILKKSN